MSPRSEQPARTVDSVSLQPDSSKRAWASGSLALVLFAALACGEGEGRKSPAAPMSPAYMEKTSGDGQEGPAGRLLHSDLEVRITNDSGDPVPGVEVDFTSSDGRVVPSRGETDADGRRSVRLLLPDGEGEVYVVASSGGLPDVEFTARGIQAAVNPYEFPIGISGRYIVDARGRPIILNGSAPWDMTFRLDPSAVERYLDVRLEQGVNAIVVRGLSYPHVDGVTPNVFGDLPFTRTLPGGEQDFTALDPDYWDFVEWIVSEARERGMICFLPPAYVGYMLRDQGWTEALESNGHQRLRAYGDSLGRRFRSHGNVIWVMGGDSNPVSEGRDVTEEMNAIASGIQRSMPDAIFTAHALRQHSALDSYDEPWLDVNSTYSDTAGGPAALEKDWERTDGEGELPMPSFWIEGYYENEHDMTSAKLRSQMYWSLLGGAVGHFYGVHPVWSFGAEVRADFGDSSAPPYDHWENALTTDLAWDLMQVRRMIDTRPMRMLVPDYDRQVVTDGRLSGVRFAAAARATDGSLIMAYLPDRREVTVDMSRITTDTVATVSWVNPRNGDTTVVGDFATDGEVDLVPPSDEDWLLVAEDRPH